MTWAFIANKSLKSILQFLYVTSEKIYLAVLAFQFSRYFHPFLWLFMVPLSVKVLHYFPF